MINKTVDGVQAVCEWEREQMILSGLKPELISVIPNGVEDIAFAQKLDATDDIKDLVSLNVPYMAMVARVHPIKNIETAINALKYVKEPCNLVVMGRHELPEYYEKLQSLVHALDLEKRVIFADQITGMNKYYILRNASIYLHTSHYEVDPISVKEGLSQGLICICADNTGTSRLIQDGVNGFLVPTNDHIKTAEKISYVLEHAESKELREIRKRNLAELKELRWTQVAQTVEQLFNALYHRWSLSYSS